MSGSPSHKNAEAPRRQKEETMSRYEQLPIDGLEAAESATARARAEVERHSIDHSGHPGAGRVAKHAAARAALLRSLLAECIMSARAEGWDEEDEPDRRYTYSRFDLEYVIASLGRRPTAREWDEAGLAWVGETHCGHDEAGE